MASLRIALLQIVSCGMDQQANLLKGEHRCPLDTEAGAVKIGAMIWRGE